MSDHSFHVLAVSGSNNANSSTRIVLQDIADRLQQSGVSVDLLDLHETTLPLLNPKESWNESYYGPLKERVVRADAIVLGTPDYHGSLSGTMKNFLDHFWKEFAGKLFGLVVASHEKGLTVHDQMRTIVRQCYAWSLPYGLSFMDRSDLSEGKITGEPFIQRLQMFVRDLKVYGTVLAAQRQADLKGTDDGFMARYRK